MFSANGISYACSSHFDAGVLYSYRMEATALCFVLLSTNELLCPASVTYTLFLASFTLKHNLLDHNINDKLAIAFSTCTLNSFVLQAFIVHLIASVVTLFKSGTSMAVDN